MCLEEATHWRNPPAANAVQAGILAASAITAKKIGKCWVGDHQGAVTYLKKAGQEGKEASRHLERLLKKKSRVEYDPIPTTENDAREAVKSSERLVALAGKVVHPTESAPEQQVF